MPAAVPRKYQTGRDVYKRQALGYPDHTSTIVDMPADGSTAYTVDEQRNYYVPKRKKEDILLWK